MHRHRRKNSDNATFATPILYSVQPSLLTKSRPTRKVCPWPSSLSSFTFYSPQRIFNFRRRGVIDTSAHRPFYSFFLPCLALPQRLSDPSHSIVICVFSYAPGQTVGIVTFQECRVTAQRYVSHAAQMPCVTTASLLAAGVGCNALPFRASRAFGSTASSACPCFRCSRYDMHDQVASSAFCLRAFLDRTPSYAFPDRTLDKTTIPCSTLLAYGSGRGGLLATPS
jgi:hypothetical protein